MKIGISLIKINHFFKILLKGHSNLYQIQRPGGGYHLRNDTVIVCEGSDGIIEVFHKSESLRYKVTPQITKQPKTVDTKEINPFINHLVSIGSEARYPQGPLPCLA